MSQGTLLDIYRRRGYWRAGIAPPAVRADAAGCGGVSIGLHMIEEPDYVKNFVIKDVIPRQRRGVKPPRWTMQFDRAARLVNVRLIFE
ncbi:MAG: hypothetical protein WD690_18015 [Vicinamibacterales bacterium]